MSSQNNKIHKHNNNNNNNNNNNDKKKRKNKKKRVENPSTQENDVKLRVLEKKNTFSPIMATFTSGKPYHSIIDNSSNSLICCTYYQNDDKSNKFIAAQNDYVRYRGPNQFDNCAQYAIGVLDEESKQMDIIPVRDIFSLERIQKKGDIDHSSSGAGQTSKDVDFLSPRRQKKRNRSEMMGIGSHGPKEILTSLAREEKSKESILREKRLLLPPFDESTSAVEDIYDINKIISQSELETLFNGQRLFKVQKDSHLPQVQQRFSKFVISKLHSFNEQQDIEVEERKYHLLQFLDDLLWFYRYTRKEKKILLYRTAKKYAMMKDKILVAYFPEENEHLFPVEKKVYEDCLESLGVQFEEVIVAPRRSAVYISFKSHQDAEKAYSKFGQGLKIGKLQIQDVEYYNQNIDGIFADEGCPEEGTVLFMLEMFSEKRSNDQYWVPVDHQLKLAFHIIILALSLANYSISLPSIMNDIQKSPQDLGKLFAAVGCQLKTVNGELLATLVAPLKFNEKKQRSMKK